MEGEKETKTVYTIRLNEEEATWLRSLVQNPIGCRPEDEPKREQKMREALFNILKRRD